MAWRRTHRREGETRLGKQVAGKQVLRASGDRKFVAPDAQAEGGVADGARHEHGVPHLGAGAAHHGALRHAPKGRDRYGEPAGSAGRVTAQQGDAVAALVGGEALREVGDPPLRPGVRQGQRQEVAERLGALGGKIGEVHPQRLAGDRAGRIVGEEMNPGGDGIGRQHQIVARPLAVEGRIVGKREGAAVAGERPEVALDQGKFAGAAGPAGRPLHAANSAGRRRWASVSSTPLTIAGTSPSKNALATSTYSVITTRAGTSGRWASS